MGWSLRVQKGCGSPVSAVWGVTRREAHPEQLKVSARRAAPLLSHQMKCPIRLSNSDNVKEITELSFSRYCHVGVKWVMFIRS